MSRAASSANARVFLGALRQGLVAARANVVPAVVLWSFALAIIVAYYNVDAARAALERVADLKTRYGYGYSIVSTAFFAGLLPWAIRCLTADGHSERHWRHLTLALVMWAYKGFEIDLLYRAQAMMFGDTNAMGTVIAKVVFDQFVYCPIWAVPVMTVIYIWKDCGYNLQATRERLGTRWYRDWVLPVLLANNMVWVPAVTFVYCLPRPLQLPVGNIILCMFVLLVMFMTRADKARGQEADSPPAPKR